MVLPNESAKEPFLIEMLPVLNEVGRIIVFVSIRVRCEVHSRRWVDTTVSMVFRRLCMGGVVSWHLAHILTTLSRSSYLKRAKRYNPYIFFHRIGTRHSYDWKMLLIN